SAVLNLFISSCVPIVTRAAQNTVCRESTATPEEAARLARLTLRSAPAGTAPVGPPNQPPWRSYRAKPGNGARRPCKVSFPADTPLTAPDKLHQAPRMLRRALSLNTQQRLFQLQARPVQNPIGLL